MSKQLATRYSVEEDVPVVFSFFSGAGFLDLGFERQGFEIGLVNEISAPFLQAYRYSREKMGVGAPKHGYYNSDINAFLGERRSELAALMKEAKRNGRLVGFIGGPPCPDFSVGGKNKGAAGVNGRLSLAYINLIAQAGPDFFLFENVKGLVSTAKHRAFFAQLKEKAHKAGYATSARLCNALEFGVPQDRERILFFGIKQALLEGEELNSCGEIPSFPWEGFIKYDVQQVKRLPWPGTDRFGGTPALASGTAEPLTVQWWFDRNSVADHPNARDHFTPRAGIGKMRTVDEGDVRGKSYKRLHRWRYSPTAAYGNNEVHLHPYRQRRLSAAEAMAIQSLPKDFVLPQDMSLSDMFKTIGNGVPFLLSEAVAKTVKTFLAGGLCRA